MKILFSLLLQCLSFCAAGQTAPADSTLAVPVTVRDAYFIAGVMPAGAPVVIAIAKAVKGKTDSSATVSVISRQREVVQVGQILRSLPEGFAAEVNARLLAVITPLCATRPWMAAQFISLRAENASQVSTRVRMGVEVVGALLEAWNRK